MTTQEFSQALVLAESQFPPSYVEDSRPPMDQMPPDLDVFKVPPTVRPFVPAQPNVVAHAAAQKAAAKEKKDGRGNNMKWQLFLSIFVFNKMCEIIASGVRTDKGFKKVHLNLVAKQAFDLCGHEVTSTQVYNHLRKWRERERWITASKLRDLSGASWDEDTCSILLEAEHYQCHIAPHPKDAEFLNLPIQNYHQLQQIFFFGPATDKHAMGSGQPLGSPMPEYPDTQESHTINVDAPEKDGDHIPILDRKRKRVGFMEEELSVFSNMTKAVKEVATAIRESKSVDFHPELYGAVIEQIGFSPEALMVALSHLLDNKA